MKSFDSACQKQHESNALNPSSRALSRPMREELNELERQRTRRTNDYLSSIRNILQVANIPTKKDKFSVIKNAHDYVLYLKSHLQMAESRIDRAQISSANESVIDRLGEGQAMESQGYVRIGTLEDGPPLSISQLFRNAGVAMALVNVEGCLVACNKAFVQLTKFTREDVESKRISVLNFVSVRAWSEMSHMNQAVRLLWSPCIFRDREELCVVSIWLVLGDNPDQVGCFHMSISPASECTGSQITTVPSFLSNKVECIVDSTESSTCLKPSSIADFVQSFESIEQI